MRHDTPGRELTPISCSRAAPSAPNNADIDNEDSSVQVCVWSFQSKRWLVALVGGLCPPHDTTNDAGFTTTTKAITTPLPACSRKCRHRWRMNKYECQAFLAFPSAGSGISICCCTIIHTKYVFLGRCSKTCLDYRLSSKRIPNGTARRQSLTAAVKTIMHDVM